MKKFLALVLATVTALSCSMVAFASSTTTLTTTVPAATYTLNIPADTTITYGATTTDIGEISVTGASGFASGKNLAVTISYDSFKCEGVTTTIPFAIKLSDDGDDFTKDVASNDVIVFKGKSDGTTIPHAVGSDNRTELINTNILIDSSDWGKALAGEYKAVITFVSEVVAE